MTRIRVLVADDNLDQRALWTGILQGEFEADVVTVNDGVTAIKCLCEEGFDLVVVDHDVPLVSGMDILRYVRARWPWLPFLLPTRTASTVVRTEARRLGAHVIAKPFGAGHAARLLAVAASRRSRGRPPSRVDPRFRRHVAPAEGSQRCSPTRHDGA